MLTHKQLSYIAKRHHEKREFKIIEEAGVDLGDTYPSVPCPTCAASWFEGCCRDRFCPERVTAMNYYDALPRDEQQRINDEDWKRFLKHRKAEEREKRQKDTEQLTLF